MVMQTIKEHFFSDLSGRTAATIVLCGIIALIAGRIFVRRLQIPTINSYSGDWMHSKAKHEFIINAQDLIDKGIKTYPDQPFRIITALSDRTFLPYAWIDWMRKHPDLDHQAAVAQDFFGNYPGFEAIGAFNDPNHFVIDLVKKRMSQISQSMLDTFDSQATRFLDANFGNGEEYHDVSWGTLCFNMTASVASAVFSGPTLAHDAEWQHLITSHTTSIFNAARALRSYPSYLRPLFHWFLSDCRACRKQLVRAREKIASYEIQEEDMSSVLAWTKDNKQPDAAVIQLALAAGAIHTSSQLLQQSVLDLALASTEQPQVIADLRKEIEAVLDESDGKIIPSSMAKLNFLDACIKETQRLKPQTLNNLERLTLKNVTLPNGQVIPKGTQVAIPSEPMWSMEQWGKDAGVWNPYRYQKIGEKMNLVSSNNKHYAFGMGRFICPGRFFVAAEIKVVLVKMLTGWDLRIRPDLIHGGFGKDGRVEWKPFGFEQIADGNVVVEVRRRK